MAELRWGDSAGRACRYTIHSDKKSVTIGRSKKCDVHLSHPGVSLEHAELTWTPRGLEIRDCLSREGVHVNGIALSMPVLLSDGDRITLGDAVEMRFLESSPRSVTPPRQRLPRGSRSARRRVNGQVPASES